jgi:hypothetical protein
MEDYDLFDVIGGEEELAASPDQPPRTFSVRPEIEPDESLLGIIARTGAENGRTRIAMVTGLVNLTTQYKGLPVIPFTPIDPAPLAVLLGIAPADVEATACYDLNPLRLEAFCSSC